MLLTKSVRSREKRFWAKSVPRTAMKHPVVIRMKSSDRKAGSLHLLHHIPFF